MIADTLRRVPLFNDLSEEELGLIAAQITPSRYDADQIVFSEGDAGGDLLIVQGGSLRVLKTAASGRQQMISIERAGSSLGEVCVFDGGCYSTTAIAMTPAVVLRLDGARLQQLCIAHPQVALKVIRVLGQRLRHLRRLVEELSFTTVRDRLIVHILQLMEERGVRGAGSISVALDENNEELAARLGTVRELVWRNLGRLHGEGLIVMRKRALTIPDEGALRRELEF